jgi:hypothetical protein
LTLDKYEIHTDCALLDFHIGHTVWSQPTWGARRFYSLIALPIMIVKDYAQTISFLARRLCSRARSTEMDDDQ